MSDDDEVSSAAYTKRAKVVHYGGLEESLRSAGATIVGPSTSVSVTISGPNINTSNKYYELSAEGTNDRSSQLEVFEFRKKARQIAVSTDDIEVRAHLRNLNHPMCLFGEDPADRRERLRQLLARLGVDAIKKNKDLEEKIAEEKEASKTWYHEGDESLLKARYWLADYSIPRAKERLEAGKAYREVPLEIREASAQDLYKKMRTMEILSSQVADQRPISSVTFSPNGKLIASSSWSGLCKLWDVPSLAHRRTLRGHVTNADEITFHPQATLSQDEAAVNLASCGVDGSVFLWNLKSEEPIHSLAGHSPHRVSSLAFHPSGRFLATCCYDHSWRLWDLEAREEILHQEGHSKPVHDVAFQSDGSLLASGGRDAFGRVWDLRTGRCVMFMDGHLKGIISLDFSPNGYQIVTGSEDNTVKIWNLRQRKLEYTIAAHTNIVSKVRFEHGNNGSYIMSASYDSTLKLWAHPAWTPIKTLSGHDGKVMSGDMSADNKWIVSCSFDRTLKLWEQM